MSTPNAAAAAAEVLEDDAAGEQYWRVEDGVDGEALAPVADVGYDADRQYHPCTGWAPVDAEPLSSP